MATDVWTKDRLEALWKHAEKFAVAMLWPDGFVKGDRYVVVHPNVRVTPEPMIEVKAGKKDTTYLVTSEEDVHGRFENPTAALEAAIVVAARKARKRSW